MPKLVTAVLITAVVFLPEVLAAQVYYGPDPGIPDTVRLSGGPLIVGQSVPIDVHIYNDEVLTLIAAALSVNSVDGGSATLDSIAFVGRMKDPSVLNWHSVSGDTNGILPDTILTYSMNVGRNDLIAGSSVEMRLFFTGNHPGRVLLDSSRYGPGYTGLTCIQPYYVNPSAEMFLPRFVPLEVQVVTAPQPPQISFSQGTRIGTVGSTLSVSVTGQSYVGGQADVSAVSMTDDDNPLRLPTNAPSVSGTNPLTFDWVPSANDVGIWSATFQVADTGGQQTTASVQLQVVTNSQYILPFEAVETDSAPNSSAIVIGDLDNDNAPELFMTAIPMDNLDAIAALDITSSGECIYTYRPQMGYNCHGPQLGYFDNDNYLDAVATNTFYMLNYRGVGNGSFQLIDSLPWRSNSFTTGTLTDFNGDAYLDYANVGWDSLSVLIGSADARFHPALTLPLSSAARSINSADFNGDDWEDLAVGTIDGLDIYLNNHGAGYTKAHSYSQTYGSLDIQVTNQGSDFNNDNIYDLCLATPSVGGTNSELMVYLGRGDGSFEQRIARTVKGQIFATGAGDFNDDNELDIAFINGARQYLAILFGDGAGNFPNEIRIPVPKYSPVNLAALDFDLDNDLDLVVASYRFREGASIFVYKNLLNPSSMSPKSLEIVAEDNAKTELVSPSGKIINNIRQSISSGAVYRRNINGNASIDQVVRCVASEAGPYRFDMTPKENMPAGAPFSLRFTIDGKPYRIAKNVAMASTGYDFTIYPNGLSPINPTLGEYIAEPKPTFYWSGQGPFRFELSTDPSFGTLVASGQVDEPVYALDEQLPDLDSAIYYWRVRPTTATNWSGFYAFNVAASPTDVDLPEDEPNLPKRFALHQNYPNPFNPITTINYDLPRRARVRLEVFNVVGQKVATLVNGVQEAGQKKVVWNGIDDRGANAASGIYFYRLTAGEFVATAKMVLLK